MTSLSLFLAYPQALYAVNKNVNLDGNGTTFERAEDKVTGEHWSRKNGS